MSTGIKVRSFATAQHGRKIRAEMEECKWREFFDDPSLWWDNRTNKRSSKHPDFVHAVTGAALWTDSNFLPLWITPKLNSLVDSSPVVGRGLRAEYREGQGAPKVTTGEDGKNVSSVPAKALPVGKAALKLYEHMRTNGETPTVSVTVAALKSCTSSRDVATAKKIHAHVASSRDDLNIFVATTLVDMYAKCGNMSEARKVFESMAHCDAVSWNAIIMGYAQSGDGEQALEFFQRMKDEACAPDSRTFVAALNACTSLVLKKDKVAWLEKGRALHSELAKSGHEMDMFAANSLVDMYSKGGRTTKAHRVLDEMVNPDVITWTGVISGYAQTGEEKMAMELFSRMQEEGCSPDGLTFVSVLNACASLAVKEDGLLVEGKLVKTYWLEKGRAIYAQLGRHESDIFVANTLVDMFSKCGCMAEAQRVFDRMQRHDVVSWTALVLGYADNAEPEMALRKFEAMKKGGVAPDTLTFIVALKACGSLAALEIGMKVHEEIRKAGVEQDLAVASSLVSFYGKCGSMTDAQKVFELGGKSHKNLVMWNALLGGYSYQGDTEMVFQLFEKILAERIVPDGLTFLSVLTACCHSGLVDKGKHYFELMSSSGVAPSIKHYSCMIDLLARSNHFKEALALVETMSYDADMTVWMSVLSSSRKWKNVEAGKAAFESLLKLDRKDAAAYVLMSNIYSRAGLWEESARVEVMRRSVKAWKKPGQSWWIDPSGKMHMFLAGDKSHPQLEEIQTKLNELMVKIKEQGYIPELDSVFHDISDQDKEFMLCEHSERLALACALLNTSPNTPVRVLKNLRVCDDCHRVTAMISKVEQREVVCRDRSRFHIFKDGKCSCGDFW